MVVPYYMIPCYLQGLSTFVDKGQRKRLTASFLGLVLCGLVCIYCQVYYSAGLAWETTTILTANTRVSVEKTALRPLSPNSKTSAFPATKKKTKWRKRLRKYKVIKNPNVSRINEKIALPTGKTKRHFPYNFTTNDDACHGFNDDPFDISIAKFAKTRKTIRCKGGHPSVAYFNREKSLLEVDRAKLASLNLKTDNCSYASLRRARGDDSSVVTSSWSKPFNTSIPLAQSVEYVLVRCYHKEKLVVNQYIGIVRTNSTREKIHDKNYANHVAKNKPDETLSVLMMGIDGTSRQNFARQFPKTKEFVLQTMGGIEFYKLNKVGSNTFPNVIPLLTGKSSGEVRQNWTDKQFFDKIDHLFLWGEARQRGYRTMVLLDRIKITSFHYLKKGWNNSEFEVYNRPLVIKSQRDRLARQKPFCIGDQPEITALYDQWLQMTALYNNTKTRPYFGYSFFAHLTHGSKLNHGSSGDEHYYTVMKTLVQQRSLNNTLILLFSDHGSRYGEYRSTYRGMLEDNNPFMFFIFPPWFRQKYHKVMSNFYKNQHSLVSHFDIHATLKDVLNFHAHEILSRKIGKTRGMSLFQELLPNRTCEEAGIPLEVCNCRNTSSLQTQSTLAKAISLELLNYTNSKTLSFRKECVSLNLNSTVTVLAVQKLTGYFDYFQVTIQTSPGGGLFEGMVRRNKKKYFKLMTMKAFGTVSRINKYGGQADCITDARIQPFCYCSNLLSSSPI